MKNIIYISLTALVIIIAVFFSRSRNDRESLANEAEFELKATKRGEQRSDDPLQIERIISRIADEAKHTLVLNPNFDISEHSEVKSISSYSRYVTPSSKIVIRDPEGRILYKADNENPFVGIRSIEGGDHIAINRGDGRYRIINTKNLESIDLPAIPPVDRPIGFSWNWINGESLIGVSGIGFAETSKTPGRCCDEHVVAASLMYLYNINNQDIEAVSIPPSLRGLVFTIGRIADGGQIELISASGHEDDRMHLGWFDIHEKK